MFTVSIKSYAEESPYALIGAAHRGDTDKVKALLSQGLDVNKKGHEYGKTALMYAVEAGYCEIAQMLLDKGADVNIVDNNGQTALMLGVRWFAYAKENDTKYAQIIQLLLDKGANINAQDNDGKTALMYMVNALNSFSPDAHVRVKSLLTAGADVYMKDKAGETAITYALERNLVDVLEIFKNNGIKSSSTGNVDLEFLSAVAMRDLNAVKKLLDQNVNINTRDERNNTALILAARGGYLDIVSLLLDKKADVEAKYGKTKLALESGNTALMFAAYGGQDEIVKALLANGADINAKNNFDNTALLLAAYRGQTEIVKLLLENGADINAKNRSGDTALWCAVYDDRCGHPELIKLLINKGVDVNTSHEYGYTPLIKAVLSNNIETVKILLAAGANPNVKSEFMKETLLKMKMREGNQEIIQLLKDAGAKE